MLDDQIGKRLSAVMIDAYAQEEPERTWVSVPVDDNDLSRGFRDVSYKQFANSIDRAARWLMKRVPSSGHEFETVAYAGPKDLRYPIIAVAALKCRKRVCVDGVEQLDKAQSHLLKSSESKAYLHAATIATVVRSVLGEDSDVAAIEIPELEEWLLGDEVEHVPYNKTWDEAADDPWLMFHTSGTTGLPKLIPYTNAMMASFDAAQLMPDAQPESQTLNGALRNRRCYISLPQLHYVGMCAVLQWAVYLNTIIVMGPAHKISTSQVVEILKYGEVEVVCLPPSLIDDICREDTGLVTLRRLSCIIFAGSTLSQRTAEQLVDYCKVIPGMGTTEAGAYWILGRGKEDWEYYKFRPANGIVMKHWSDKLYEVVFRKDPELRQWQQLFKLYPDLDEFPTKDLWTRHPEHEDLWRYAGRTDDMVVLSHGEDLFATGMESIVQEHPRVRAALIGGDARPRPFLVIDLVDKHDLSETERNAALDDVWPFIERANKQCSQYVKLTRELVLFTKPTLPLPLTAKDTVLRAQALELYNSDIDNLYNT